MSQQGDRTRDRINNALLAAWDDGNATGLDGWVGPERGEHPDIEAIRARERCVDLLLAELNLEHSQHARG